MTRPFSTQLFRMRRLARGMWDAMFTTQATLWEDEKYRIVCYRRTDRHDGRFYEELWHASEGDPDRAVYLTSERTADPWSASSREALSGPKTRQLP